MRMLCGLSRPTEGEGFVAGYDIARQSEAVKKNIGYMSQKFSLYEDLKVWENLRLFGGIYGMKERDIKSKTERILHELGLEQERNTPVRSLPWAGNRNWPSRCRYSTTPRLSFSTSPPAGSTPLRAASSGA